MRKYIIILLALNLCANISAFSQITINGKEWKPKSKEEKEAEKKKKEEEKLAEEKRKEDLKREEENKLKYPKSEIDRITDKEMYPSNKDDCNKLSNILSIYQTANSYNQDEIKAMNKFPQSLKDIEKIKTTYKEYLEMSIATKLTYHMLGDKDWYYYGSVSEMEKFKKKIAESYANPLELGKKKEQAIKLKVDYKKNNNTPVSGYDEIDPLLQQITFYKEVSKFLKGEGNPEEIELQLIKKNCEEYINSVTKPLIEENKAQLAKKEKEEMQEREKRNKEDVESHNNADFNDKMEGIEKVKCPVDGYTGADKQSLKNSIITEWNEKNRENENGAKILKVYITGKQWERKTGYDGLGTGTASKFDVSTLDVQIIYQTNNSKEIAAKVATIEYTKVCKDHLNPGKKAYLSANVEEGPYIYLSVIK